MYVIFAEICSSLHPWLQQSHPTFSLLSLQVLTLSKIKYVIFLRFADLCTLGPAAGAQFSPFNWQFHAKQYNENAGPAVEIMGFKPFKK